MKRNKRKLREEKTKRVFVTPYTIYAECERKERFDEAWRAGRIADKMMKKHEGKVFEIYWCPFCKGYHVAEIKRRKGNGTNE